jgi:hypothetical protein
MNGPHEDVPPQSGGEQSFDREHHGSNTNTTVPPPAQHEIDALVDAVSAGHRGHVGARAERASVADDATGVARAARPRDRHETARAILPRAMRIVAGSLAAFALGVLITWSVVRRFDGPGPPGGSPRLSMSAPAPAAPTPADAPAAAAPVPATPAPNDAVAATPRAPAAPPPVVAAPPAAPITRSTPRESTAVPPPSAREPRRATTLDAPIAVAPAPPPAAVPAPEAAAAPPPAPPVPLPTPPAIVAAAPAAAAPAAPPAPVTPPRPTDVDQAAVIAAVREYEHAYEAMDVSATAAVWPSVDRRALTRAFGTLRSQALDLRNCQVTVAQDHATARCRGTVAYVPKIGQATPRTGRQEWVFHMRKIGDVWVIDGLDASPIAAVWLAASPDHT